MSGKTIHIPCSWHACRSLCSRTSIRKTRNVKHTGLSLQRERCITCFMHRKLGVDKVSSLVTFALSVWLGHVVSLSWTCLFQAICSTILLGSSLEPYLLCSSIELTFMELVTCAFTKSFDVVMPKALLCTWDWVNYHQEKFHQILLCVK